MGSMYEVSSPLIRPRRAYKTASNASLSAVDFQSFTTVLLLWLAMVFLGRFSALLATCLLFAAQMRQATAFDNSRNDNLAVYYGQNSYGATHPDQSGWQKDLSTYCQDDTINAIPIAFLHVYFSTGGLPEIDLANICSKNGGVFPGTSLAKCQSLAGSIKACQARGKIVTLSLGGATGNNAFSSDAQAQTFADTLWNLFLGGSSSTRPFGDAVLDGVDLDIEGGGTTGYVAFVNRIRSRANGASKKYYVTAAPQCVYPDASLGAVLNAASFDAVYVQYNNWCGVQNYNNPNAWNFGTWDNWAKTISPNKNVKVYIGAPASSTAAGSGYVDAATLGNIAKQTRSQYSSFGGIMLWDASQAYGNNRFDRAVKSALAGGGSGTTPTPTPTSTPPGGGGCSGVGAWVSTSIYTNGNKVTYNGRLWTAKWWTQGDVPGGAADVWTNGGACFAKVATSKHEATGAPAPAPPKVTPVPKPVPGKDTVGDTKPGKDTASVKDEVPKPAPKPSGTADETKATVGQTSSMRRGFSRFFLL
ncbi:Chitinase 1 [Hypsizygus marmoreus]|uniref:chitinase n=1 Tax=Hypsizygus marmoreus TaxID=39966 RepID=A0A369J340_HYPMA|nr:Chitinase 1 [Hypsizygus marmoreus]